MHYRLYRLTGENHIESREDLYAEDDASAVLTAQELVSEADCELWCGTRKVTRLIPHNAVVRS